MINLYRAWISIGAILLITSLAACGSSAEPTPTPASPEEAVQQAVPQLPFIGTAWQVESAGEAADDLEPIEGTRLSVNFGIERYTGSGGCNWFLGAYETEGDALRFYTPAKTELICTDPEGVMEQEATYLSLLVNVTEYREEGDNLLAYTVDDQLLLTLVPADPVPLEDTNWSLKFQITEDQPTPSFPGVETTAVFANGTVSGSGGCNSYEASYEITGERLSIGPLTFTEKSCDEPSGIMEQESAYFAALEAVESYAQLGGVLQLYGGIGQPLLMLGAP